MSNYDIEKELVKSAVTMLERAAKILRSRYNCDHGNKARGINYGLLETARKAEHCSWMMDEDSQPLLTEKGDSE